MIKKKILLYHLPITITVLLHSDHKVKLTDIIKINHFKFKSKITRVNCLFI